jgi:cell division transport system permease protein
MRAQFILSEIGIGLRRNLTMTIAAVVTIAVSLAMFGAVLLIRAQTSEMKGYWYDKVEVSIFLCSDIDKADNPACSAGAVTDSQRDAIRADLEAMSEVETVLYESKEEAYQHFKEDFGDSAFSNEVTADQLPESFRVKLKDPEQFAIITSAFEGRPGVQSVVDQRQLLERFFALLNMLTSCAFVAAILLLIATVLLIANTIRVAAFSRRRETRIMRLVGASNFYIQVPFLLEGAIAGLIGGLIAWLLLAAVYQFLVLGVVKPQLESLIQQWIDWGVVIGTAPVIVGVGVVVSVLASFVTIRRYLRV